MHKNYHSRTNLQCNHRLKTEEVRHVGAISLSRQNQSAAKIGPGGPILAVQPRQI